MKLHTEPPVLFPCKNYTNGHCIDGNSCGFGRLGKPVVIQCDVCNGTNLVGNLTLVKIEKGKIIREERIARRITLRNEAKRLKVDASELSKLERGAY